ncbi:MAG: 2-hydroxyacyl-CoA dehydratase family protein [Myxococcota bacterium]
MLDFFRKAVAEPLKTVEYYSENLGRDIVILFPGYFPVELIHAHSLYPVQVWEKVGESQAGDSYLQPFACSLAQSLALGFLSPPFSNAKAYAFTTICDTLQNLSEILKYKIRDKEHLLFVLPTTSDPIARNGFLERQLKELREKLEEIGRVQPSRDEETRSLEFYNGKRQLLRKLYGIRRKNPSVLSARDFYTVVAAGDILPVEIYNEELERLTAELSEKESPKSSAPRVMLNGIIPRPWGVLDILDSAGLSVADDDMLFGRRRFFRSDLSGTDATSYDEHIFCGATCSFLYIESINRVFDFKNLVAESGVEGVIIWQIKFCEPEAFERVALKSALDELSVPSLAIEVELGMKNLAGIETRIEGFSEMLKEKR